MPVERLARISHCQECPHFASYGNNWSCFFDGSSPKTVIPNLIPDWCPLPKVKEDV